jgi:hypothetical protein
VTDTAVPFWYRDHRDGRKILMRLLPDAFLPRWLEYVPPRGLRTVRRSGLYANSCASQREAIRQSLTAVQPETPATAAAETVKDLELRNCPQCNTEVRCRDLIPFPVPDPGPRQLIATPTQPP